MKIVLDTNVLISVFAFEGFSKEAFEHCFTYHQLHISEWIIEEFEEKMVDKLKVPGDKIEAAVNQIRKGFNVDKPTSKMPTICRDKDDNNILQLAESINADYIITGDHDLLTLINFKGTQIKSPRDFWDTVIKPEH